MRPEIGHYEGLQFDLASAFSRTCVAFPYSATRLSPLLTEFYAGSDFFITRADFTTCGKNIFPAPKRAYALKLSRCFR